MLGGGSMGRAGGVDTLNTPQMMTDYNNMKTKLCVLVVVL